MEIYVKIWENNEMKKSSLTISLFNFDYFPDDGGKKVDAKNEDEDEKIWKNEFDFWILHMKIRSNDNFHEDFRKKNWPIF